jgi:NAD-dependent deacetylase
MKTQIQQAARVLASAKQVIALTGAGISVESGIPPFRGKGGLWEKIDPMKYAHIRAFERNPVEVWNVLFKMLNADLVHAQPNKAHHGLARLERLGRMHTVITQNIDGLHQRAGQQDVIEFHGTFASHSCMICRKRIASNHLDFKRIPPKCSCGGILRPDVVMFGEAINPERLQRAQMLASTCDVMLVVGTSATVEPAAYLPVIAKRGGATIVEINPDPTHLSGRISDMNLLGPAGEMVEQLVAAVELTQTLDKKGV